MILRAPAAPLSPSSPGAQAALKPRVFQKLRMTPPVPKHQPDQAVQRFQLHPDSLWHQRDQSARWTPPVQPYRKTPPDPRVQLAPLPPARQTTPTPQRLPEDQRVRLNRPGRSIHSHPEIPLIRLAPLHQRSRTRRYHRKLQTTRSIRLSQSLRTHRLHPTVLVVRRIHSTPTPRTPLRFQALHCSQSHPRCRKLPRLRWNLATRADRKHPLIQPDRSLRMIPVNHLSLQHPRVPRPLADQCLPSIPVHQPAQKLPLVR